MTSVSSRRACVPSYSVHCTGSERRNVSIMRRALRGAKWRISPSSEYVRFFVFGFHFNFHVHTVRSERGKPTEDFGSYERGRTILNEDTLRTMGTEPLEHFKIVVDKKKIKPKNEQLYRYTAIYSVLVFFTAKDKLLPNAQPKPKCSISGPSQMPKFQNRYLTQKLQVQWESEAHSR